MRVPVLDSHRTPLMPATPARARLLLKQGKAKPYWNKLGIFCIILTYEVQPDNQDLVVGIDPGSSFEGWSVVGTKETVLNGMSEAPKHVKKAVETRRTMRRARRGRNCWRRPARFNNRLQGRKFMPPSTFARWNAKIRILQQLQKILPITAVVVEDVAAVSKKNGKRWNKNFSPLEVGKKWFYIRMDSLPSAPIPEGVDTTYPVWAVDQMGMALVGPGADEVESVEEVRAACEEQGRRMRGIPLRCHKCGHTWMYRGGSQYRTTCPACHVTVYFDKCEITLAEMTRGGSGA